MSVLSRYLTKQVFLAMLLVFVFMTSFFFILRFLDEVNYQLAGDYQVKEAFYYILLTTAETNYEYMPFIIMIGCLFALGNLSNYSELTVLRAAGMSISAIVRPVFINVALLLFVVMLVNETLTPKWSHQGDVLKQSAASQGGSSIYGEWKKEGNSFVYLGAVDDSKLSHVQSFRFIQNQLMHTQSFPKLAYNNDELTWQSAKGDVSWRFKQGRWIKSDTSQPPNFEFTPDILQANQVRDSLLSLKELIGLMNYSQNQQIDKTHFSAAFYLKVFMPIITLALVWMCSIFVFGSTRKTAIGTRIFIGVLVGIILKLMQNLLTPMVINYSLHPVFLGLIPLIIIVVMGLYLQRKIQ